MKCPDCKFVQEVEYLGKTYFECRRFPPDVPLPPPGGTYLKWPNVREADWCGEFKLRAGGKVDRRLATATALLRRIDAFLTEEDGTKGGGRDPAE